MISFDSGTEDIAMILETERLILRPWCEDDERIYIHTPATPR